MADPVTTMTLLKMAGLSAGLKGLGGFLSRRDDKRNARRQAQQERITRMIQSLSPQRMPGQAAVTPQRRGTAASIAGQFNQNVTDPLIAQILPQLIGRIPGMGG